MSNDFALDESAIREAFRRFLFTFGDRDNIVYFRKIANILDSGSYSLVIDYADLAVKELDLAKLLIQYPREVLKILSNEFSEILTKEFDVPVSIAHKYRVRVRGVPNKLRIRDLFRSINIGRMVEFEAIVVRATKPKQILRESMFMCEKCGRKFRYTFDIFYRHPRYCPYLDCDSQRILLLNEGRKYEEYQELVIQELPEELPPGKLPRQCNVVAYGDNVDIARPGDRVTITGVVLVAPERKLGDGKKPLFETYVEAIHIDRHEETTEEARLSEEETEHIRQLAEREGFEEMIYMSIAPSIYGLEDIKKAIAAQLFGGVPKIYPDGTRIRGDIHILLIGDPGTAKSQLLKYVANLAPRALYTTGKGATAAGLTAAVVKTEDGWALEAGVLVLCDKGIACIDEFDKMREDDRRAIHEALEQQTVSIAKAGIVATLNARTSVLAAANPKYGVYNPSIGLRENLDLPPTILSRFDLIFVIRDQPNEEKDRSLARYILNLHHHGSTTPPIPPELFRKIVLYAREHIIPRLTEKAKKILEEFYIAMRSAVLKYRDEELGVHPIPITPRYLEALIRLAEAHARMLFKKDVDEEDAKFAIELMSKCLKQVAYDVDSETIDIGAIYTGETLSRRTSYAYVLNTIKRLMEEYGQEGVPIEEIIKRCSAKNISQEYVMNVINKEKQVGLLYEPKPGRIAFTPQ